jgi:prophage DNA circulation protein
MLIKENNEITRVITSLLDNLEATISSQTGLLGAEMRQQIGKVRADYFFMIENGTFASELLACFTKAREAGVQLPRLAYVRTQLIADSSTFIIAKAIIQNSINFCLATEVRMISVMEFTSRDDVEAMMKRTKTAFDAARDKAADDIDSEIYKQLTFLSGAITNHLANTARPLPRIINFKFNDNFPALMLSNRIYYVATRAEELIAENKIVHPAFMTRELRGLSQ